jgi:hypothetical protein
VQHRPVRRSVAAGQFASKKCRAWHSTRVECLFKLNRLCSRRISATLSLFLDVTMVDVAGSVVPMADHVKLLGVTLDNHLSMDKHVNELSRTLRHIRPAITASDANMIACSVVGSQLDYAKAVLYGVSSKNIIHLQRIQNALARCVVDSKVHRSSNALLQQPHWLSIHQHIDFKLAKLAFLSRSSATSSYLNSSVARYLPSRTRGLKTIACSLFPGQRQSLVRARFASLLLPFLILFFRT